jgi:hypothetical protein
LKSARLSVSCFETYKKWLKFRISGSKFKIRGSKFKIRGSKFKIRKLKFKIRGSKFKIRGSKFKIRKLKFKIREDASNPARVYGFYVFICTLKCCCQNLICIVIVCI